MRYTLYRKGVINMNKLQLNQMKNAKGFIAALDQSGGSTPKALINYGVTERDYQNETEMYEKVHEMRTRIIKSPAFSSDRIIGAILFKQTMRSKIDGLYTADYLWEKKEIIPFLKVDEGLTELEDGVKLMKEMPALESLLNEAKDKNIFGTKMRSVIYEDHDLGIEKVVKQQFDVGKQILEHDLMPIIEPEVDIHAKDKESIEIKLKAEIFKHLDNLEAGQQVMLKLTPPSVDNFYQDLINDERVLRLVFLSGGYPQEIANDLLAKNQGAIASFSRALSEGLNINQSDHEFNEMMKNSIETIYQASIK